MTDPDNFLLTARAAGGKTWMGFGHAPVTHAPVTNLTCVQAFEQRQVFIAGREVRGNNRI